MYHPLDASRKEIRLLHVHPGGWSDDIECHLETVSLNDNPDFYAISYVWGDPSVTLPITIDGEPLAITRNLRNGLQRLRRPDKTLMIYADAACINQSDLSERSEQVQLMGEIYSSAQHVYIWLGYGRKPHSPLQRPDVIHFAGDDSDMKIANAYFEQVRSVDQDNIEDTGPEDVLGLFVFLAIRAMNWHLHDMPFFRVQESTLYARQAWVAVVRAAETLHSNVWWTRIWVVQEIVLACQATVVYCNINIPWNVIVNAARAGSRHDSRCCSLLHALLPRHDTIILDQLHLIIGSGTPVLKRFRQREVDLSLGDVMRLTGTLDATDARDRVFAILGLVTDWQGNPPTIPDYSLSPKEVFIQATIKDIQGTGSLRALVDTGMAGMSGNPSWVTNMSLKSRDHIIKAQIRFVYSTMYCTAGETKVKIERRGDSLVIDAFEPLDAVSQIGPLVYDTGLSWQDLVNSIKRCQLMAEFNQKTRLLYPEKKRREDAFWRTATLDRWRWHSTDKTESTPMEGGIEHHTQAASQRTFESISREQETVMGAQPRNMQRFGNTDVASLGADFLSHCESQTTNNKQGTMQKANDSRVAALMDHWVSTSWRRRFFITQDGHMGLGPAEVLPGDNIAILLGGDVPFCLRSVPDAPEGHYTIVGDIYVHDLMDGEGVPPNWKDHVVKIHLH